MSARLGLAILLVAAVPTLARAQSNVEAGAWTISPLLGVADDGTRGHPLHPRFRRAALRGCRDRRRPLLDRVAAGGTVLRYDGARLQPWRGPDLPAGRPPGGAWRLQVFQAQ